MNNTSSPGDIWQLPLLRSGVVDLRVGTPLQPCPNGMPWQEFGAAFDQGATCPQWLAFLDAVFAGDAEVISFIQRAVGYSLTGSVDEEVLFFLYGIGANGKSVFTNVLKAVFGDYAVTVPASLLSRVRRGEPGDFSMLHEARFALMNDGWIRGGMDAQRTKELVSGDSKIARRGHSELFSFTPTHKLWIQSNHPPTCNNGSEAFWRRIILIPFTRQFAEHERVIDLDRLIIDSERDGVLMWAIEGCLDWQRGGLRIPAAIRKATAQYRADSDLMGA